MKKEKGFTLIELLAVIIILGIITVVAVPKILDVISKSKESATSSSIKLVKDAIKTQIAASDLTGPVFTKETDGCYLFDFDDQESGNAKVLEIKNKDRVSGSIKYCNNAFSDDTLKFDGNSISKDEPKGKIICKRASTLHTTTCTDTGTCESAGYTNSGLKGTTTITYGNLGTKGVLNSGDAFDCDVNGDGTFDSNTERFYYMTDMGTDIANLIYYSNVTNGKPSNNAYAYSSDGNNSNGPVTVTKQLPTTSQWSSVALKNNNRIINNENGEGNINFSYEGYAARLASIEDINFACNIKVGSQIQGELDNCNYLLENTNYTGNWNSAGLVQSYGYWLENPSSKSTNYSWAIDSNRRVKGEGYSIQQTNTYSARPVIEIAKKNIDY